jgi:Ca2+-binding RTX toxin-like protein
MLFYGTSGDDVITGTASNDLFEMQSGGDDIVIAGAGNDVIAFGASFTAADVVDGGTGNDEILLDGNYNTRVIFGTGNLTSVETVALTAGSDYLLGDNALSSRLTLTVDGSALGTNDQLDFQASGVSGRLILTGGADGDILMAGSGNDRIVAGAGNDYIRPGSGDNSVNAGSGNDTIIFNAGETFTTAGSIDGGTGTDALWITGNYTAPLVFTSLSVTNVESIILGGGSFDITINDNTVAAGKVLSVSGQGLTSADSLTFRGGADTDGILSVGGGPGADILVAGAGNDYLDGALGADVLTGGPGYDIFGFEFGAVSSTGANFDHVTDLSASTDRFELQTAVTGVDATVIGGALSIATFDTQLAAAIGATQLHLSHAVLFEPTTGDQHGHTFLVVDSNGVAGYQAGQDLVVDVSGMTGTLTTANFFTFH